MPRKVRRKPRHGVLPEVRRFQDLLRDLDSVRRRIRNYERFVTEMAMLAHAMRSQMKVLEEPTSDESPFQD